MFAGVTEGMKQSKPAKEVAFEVPGDLLNETGGPKKGRLAARKVDLYPLLCFATIGPPTSSLFKACCSDEFGRVVRIPVRLGATTLGHVSVSTMVFESHQGWSTSNLNGAT
jgi:hypothetical protein